MARFASSLKLELRDYADANCMDVLRAHLSEIETVMLDVDMPRGLVLEIDMDRPPRDIVMRIDFCDPSDPDKITETHGKILEIHEAENRAVMGRIAQDCRDIIKIRRAAGNVIYRNHLY